MTQGYSSSTDFDLTPHPRILPMLGEIVLPQWRCLAELIDNSVDSFLEARRTGSSIQIARIGINVPTGNSQGGLISVRDNGPGMTVETLQNAARAGWTSHDPINNLGLFGMGFNIATARLGSRTTIWTTRSGDTEWVGLKIDFNQLIKQEGFITPGLIRPKQSPDMSGTEVTIESLKTEQLEWFRKASNRSNLSRQLGRTYSSMIGPAGTPVRFLLEINGNQVRPKLHCIWGGPENSDRTVETSRHGTVNAFQAFDTSLESRPFCTQCWNWLGVDQEECPSCGSTGTVVNRERRVHGWIGIQRYLDRNDYGIDIIRNGRKIEMGNKDIFKWANESNDGEETEYPIDDPRDRGRIVGEIHLDHCRVPYTKDRFVREDTAWSEMVEIVRGRGPLRPDIASNLGFGENTSPLYVLFQAFRRSNPHNRRTGGWNKILVVPDNDRAKIMARKFDLGESEYRTDLRWWELIEEAETSVLDDDPAPQDDSTETLGGNDQDDPDLSGTDGHSDETGSPARIRLAALSQQYTDDTTDQRFDVEAFAIDSTDLILAESTGPWLIRRNASGIWEFFVDTANVVFRSMTLTPLDALLAELAWLISDYERGQQDSQATFASVLAGLRLKYAVSSMLNPQDMVYESSARLIDLARSIVGLVSPDDVRAFFDDLPPPSQENIRVTMASRGVVDPHGAIDDGRFLEYSPPTVTGDFVLSNPSFFFDGRYWDDEYATLDFGSSVATHEAQKRIRDHYRALLADVVWLSQQAPSDLEDISRERLMRASLANELLAPTGVVGGND